MKDFLASLLAKKARAVLKKQQPIIIGVTGSVGKTSTRHAIATILAEKYRVVTAKENYNNEFGLPLSILQEQSPGKSVLGWMKILLASPKSPADVYVLEYGIDHPGDMDYLLSIAMPSIAVLTALSPVHEEFFDSLEAIAEEKSKLLAAVPQDGMVYVNADDEMVKGCGVHAKGTCLSYGFKETADVCAKDYAIHTRSDFSFEPGEIFSQISATVHVGAEEVFIALKNQLGKVAISSLLPGVGIAKQLGLSQSEIDQGISKIKNDPGRMNPIPGIKGSLIIDASYNAAPASMMAALAVLEEFEPVESSKRIAVLGNMAELGDKSEQEHRMIGMRAAEICDRLVTVGEMAHHMRHAAIEAGMPEEHTHEFMSAEEAGRWLDQEIKKGDIVLVKGSQSIRMEKVVKDVMAEPLRAKELLVRQSKKWIG